MQFPVLKCIMSFYLGLKYTHVCFNECKFDYGCCDNIDGLNKYKQRITYSYIVALEANMLMLLG